MARLLPVLWPLLPMVYAPLSGVLGPRLYRLVARNHGRLGCRGDACVVM